MAENTPFNEKMTLASLKDMAARFYNAFEAGDPQQQEESLYLFLSLY